MMQRDLDCKIIFRVAGDTRFELHRIAFDVRRPADFLDVGARHLLEPDGLPDAGGARVPDRMRLELPVLLAARLRQIVRVVLSMHRHCLRARRIEQVCDVRPKWRVPAFVRHRKAVVDPDLRRVIDRAEPQDHSTVVRNQRELSLVPARAMQSAVADAARSRFGRKRHHDFQWPLENFRGLRKGAVIIKAKAPFAIQRRPLRTLHQRARVAKLRLRLRHRYLYAANSCDSEGFRVVDSGSTSDDSGCDAGSN